MKRTVTVLAMVTVLTLVLGAAAFAAPAEAPAAAPLQRGLGSGLIAIAAALCVAFGAIGTAWAQSRIGSAAAGAMAERPELRGSMLIFLALPETMVILGFLVAFLMLNKI